MVYVGKTSIQDVKVDKDLNPQAKECKIKYLRNKDKNTYIRVLSLWDGGPGRKIIKRCYQR